jgi:cAMP phosphodiesterase
MVFHARTWPGFSDFASGQIQMDCVEVEETRNGALVELSWNMKGKTGLIQGSGVETPGFRVG